MVTPYVLAFSAERTLVPEEIAFLAKKLTRALHTSPFGPWKPGGLDQPELSNISLHREIDPLLGYDKAWMVGAVLDHLRVQEQRIARSGMNSLLLADLKFSLSRLDELAGEKVACLTAIRALVEANVY